MSSEEPGCELVVFLAEGGVTPKRATSESAGYDLYCPKTVRVDAQSSLMIDTGVHMAIPSGWYGEIHSRSSHFKNFLHSTGVIDSDYRGSVRVVVHNHRGMSHVFEKGERIAQIIFKRYEAPAIVEVGRVEDLPEHNTGRTGGFGSTGK